MSLVLGRKATNQSSPNPQRVRDHNSPANPATDVALSHGSTFKPPDRRGQLASCSRRAVRIEKPRPSVFHGERRTISGENDGRTPGSDGYRDPSRQQGRRGALRFAG